MKTNLVKLIIALVGFIAFSSCSSDRTIISKKADLYKYKYASVIQPRSGYNTGTDIEINSGIYDAVDDTRLELIGERRVNELSRDEREHLVLVRYAATSNSVESVLSVTFEDYMSGRIVVSCRSSNKTGFTRERDVKKAIKKLSKRIVKAWR